MVKTYYETLGVAPTAKSSEIKAAYRRLVLKHHPDKSKDPAAPQIFRTITEAFEILGDPDARKRYDTRLADEARSKREAAEREAQRKRRLQQVADEAAAAYTEPAGGTATATQVRPKVTPAELAEMVRRLSILYSRQRLSECEMLARQIIQVDPRQAAPYAVMGDIARGRGNLEDAARMYSMALQMEPTNQAYLRNYEEILDRSQTLEGRGYRMQMMPQEKRTFAILAISAITLLACIYIILAPEKPMMGSINVISTWTIGLIVMLFLCGASAGAALSISNLIDRVDSSSTRRFSPSLLYGLLSVFSFPLALFLYGIIGASQKSFTITTTRLMGTVASITACLSIGAGISQDWTSFLQTLTWGGNLVYLGAIAGWAVADGLRQ